MLSVFATLRQESRLQPNFIKIVQRQGSLAMFPIIIYTRKKLFRDYTGFSFFIFIWIWKGEDNKEQLIRHETIHFKQQVGLLFIFHWLLYAGFHLFAWIAGKKWHDAYLSNPFEREAYANEHDVNYIRNRKLLAWIRYAEA